MPTERFGLIKVGGKDATPPSLGRQGGVVEVGIEAQERQLETVLTPRLAVTRPGIAAASRQDRLHVQFKAHTFRGGDGQSEGPGTRRQHGPQYGKHRAVGPPARSVLPHRANNPLPLVAGLCAKNKGSDG